MNRERQGWVAAVTGAGSGIGLATCRRLLAAGYAVAAMDRNPQALTREFSDNDAVLVLPVDVADSAQVNAAFAQLDRRFGRLDALVTAAGIGQPSSQATGEFGADITQISDADFREVIQVNLEGTFYAMRAAVPILRRNGLAGGAIVTISSVGAIAPVALSAPYPASKAGVLGLTRSTAALLAGENIRVNAVAPGATDTPMLAMNGPEAREVIINLAPLARTASADEMAATVLFLLSDDGSFFTGQTISPNGGIVM